MPAAVPNRHRLKRIVEGGTTLTTNSVALIIDGEDTAQFSMVTTESEVHEVRERSGDALPQRKIF